MVEKKVELGIFKSQKESVLRRELAAMSNVSVRLGKMRTGMSTGFGNIIDIDITDGGLHKSSFRGGVLKTDAI